MRYLFRILAPALVLVALSAAARSHEFWIEPREFQVETGAAVVADIRNGQNFNGIDLGWFDRRIARAEWQIGDQGGAIEGRSGDVPAITLVADRAGLLRLVYQSAETDLRYSEWEKFESFVVKKGFAGAVGEHRARGLPETGFKELYTRYCKALVAVGDGAGQDGAVGLEAEIVALANPYTDDLSGGLPVLMLYRGAPLAGGRLNLFDRAPDGTVVASHIDAGGDGRVVVPVRRGHVYLLDTVVVRAIERDGAVWESLWASLSFAVPG